MNILGIIPARFGSTRFPGKPLAQIDGKSMIQRVYEQCIKSKRLNRVMIATDDERIMNHVRDFGGHVAMTSPLHQSGTDRCAEIVGNDISVAWDVVINIQGDEPYIHPEQIELLCDLFSDPSTQIATLVKKITTTDELFNHNNVKAVMDKNKKAMYFSRSPIPYNRNFPDQEWLKHSNYFKHIGIYGYKTEVLLEITKLAKTNLENTESLEQLRWLENGYSIRAEITSLDSISIDTPEDLDRVKNM
ncbi:MAG: 3-deoxy-manno-octulosonate cytidylyltransferase [Bacteroidetes bacterium]|nr:MAG: 3-deoxy-manno-octulosonate cytidylyltransferase [Bacteroidota bacterium]REK03400.1 MAG: 3-deoxy-manno-octulosonate cytidylyltransferase [Bacteroidota bacterium]REK34488.1 MAG: 3-deoxy-manno-octulosonate cytidylyltransferase [Bacteroidota bacterium]REK50394.1 MAG: 3-deoxy-manno-octulosonate cytidylyltransferase [Bacteroidota bacterium]